MSENPKSVKINASSQIPENVSKPMESMSAAAMDEEKTGMGISGIPTNKSTKKSTKQKPRARGAHHLNGNVMDKDLIDVPMWIQELMHRQPTLNLMTIGHVSNGKSTLMYALGGEKTSRISTEIKRNMTIKLGYTSAKIWKCVSGKCRGPERYFSSSSDKKKAVCKGCQSSSANKKVILIRHFSFVDCPGHASLMGTMISGSCVADGAIMVVDASRGKFPGQQTEQHMNAAHLLGVVTRAYSDDLESKTDETRQKLVVAQNKIDLITSDGACRNLYEIRHFLRSYGCGLERSPVIPISAQSALNIDALIMSLVQTLPSYSPRLDGSRHNTVVPNTTPLLMNVIRSFDINRPQTFITESDLDKLAGGVIGGVILSGQVCPKDLVEIRPGLILRDRSNKSRSGFKVYPIVSQCLSMKCGRQSLKVAYSGANVGMQLTVDPYLTKGDRMVGHIIGSHSERHRLPPVFCAAVISYTRLDTSRKAPFEKGELIRLNIGSHKVEATIKSLLTVESNAEKGDPALRVDLNNPVCAAVGSLVAVTRKLSGTWILSAGAVIRKVRKMPLYDIETQQVIKPSK